MTERSTLAHDDLIALAFHVSRIRDADRDLVRARTMLEYGVGSVTREDVDQRERHAMEVTTTAAEFLATLRG